MPSSQIIQKNYPSDFSKDVLDVLGLMTLPNTFRTALLGSSALKISYASDFDAYSEVNITQTTTQEFQEAITKLMNFRVKDFEKMRRQDKAIYIGDIKAGVVERFRIVPEDLTNLNWNSSLNSMLLKTKNMFKQKIINKDEYDTAIRLLQKNLTFADVIITKNELNFEVCRWRPYDVLKGFVIYRGEKIMLDKALYEPARVKIDCLTWVGGNRYTELSMVYKFYKDGKIIYDENYKLEQVLKEQVLVNNYNGNYMKMAKRMLSIERFKTKPDEMIIKQLFVLFNSDLGRLTQIISDIDNYVYMIEHYAELKGSPLPIYRFQFESDQFKSRLSQIVNKSYLRHEMFINSLITKLETAPIDVNILNNLRDELDKIVQENTLIYLKQNRLYPVARMFMPKEEQVLIPRGKDSPEKDINASSGDTVVGTTMEGKGQPLKKVGPKNGVEGATPLTYKNKFNEKYGFEKDASHSIAEIAKITGYQLKHLKMIFNKGEGAYFSNRQSVRPTVHSPEQWAMARIYSAVMGGDAAKVDAAHLIKQPLKKIGPKGGSKGAPPLHCMPVKELVSEHKRIVGELKTVPTLKKEYQTQKKELAKYQKMDGSGTPFKTAAKKAGMTMHSFAEKHKEDKGKLGARSRFFLNVIERHMKNLKKMKGGEIRADYLKEFFSAAYEPVDKIGDYILDKELSNSVAVVYYDKKKDHAVVSIRGSTNLRDHLNNAIFAISGITGYKLTDRFKDAKRVFDSAVKKYGEKNISLLGYSQGSIAALELGKDVFEMILFNPASKPGYNTVSEKNEYIVKGSTDPISNLNPFKKNDERTTIIKTDDLGLKASHNVKILDRIGQIMIGKEFD